MVAVCVVRRAAAPKARLRYTLTGVRAAERANRMPEGRDDEYEYCGKADYAEATVYTPENAKGP